jgi:hypothetical protein
LVVAPEQGFERAETGRRDPRDRSKGIHAPGKALGSAPL